MKKQYLGNILRNRWKLLNGKVFWVSIKYRQKTGKRMMSQELQFNCPVYVTCACISDEAIGSDFSQ